MLGNNRGEILPATVKVASELCKPAITPEGVRGLVVITTTRPALALPVLEGPITFTEFPPWVEREDVTPEEIADYQLEHANDPEPRLTALRLKLHRHTLGGVSISAAFSRKHQVWAVNPASLEV